MLHVIIVITVIRSSRQKLILTNDELSEVPLLLPYHLFTHQL